LAAGLTAVVFGAAASTSPAAAPADVQMTYFRAGAARDCNVYMNYSFYRPNFSLKARNPALLTPAQASFLAAFNANIQDVVDGAGASCRAPASGAKGLEAGTARKIYSACLALDARLGISEDGWGHGRMPAPSNCISPKLSAPGTFKLIDGDLPAPPMSLRAWMAKAADGETGRPAS
jgi:hypothetical protein